MTKVGIFNQPKVPGSHPIRKTINSGNQAAGDYYGTGIKAKIGRMRGDSTGQVEVSPARMKNPPKSLA